MQDTYFFEIENEEECIRIDSFLKKHLPCSRCQIKKWIESKNILLNKTKIKTSYKLRIGDVIDVSIATEDLEDNVSWKAEEGELDIRYEDDDMLILNKPIGKVMYPAAGHSSGTLANTLLYKFPFLSILPRCGIIHRIDKDTSGLLVVAKTLEQYAFLVEQMQERHIKRRYFALTYGIVSPSGEIITNIGRHRMHRQRMSVVEGGGKVAITRFELQQTIGNFSLVEVELQTGRTHQIRVHMSHIGHGLVGDKTYKSVVNWKFVNPKLKKLTQSFPRQALHAWKLSVPQRNGEYIEVKSDLPDDIAELISEMKEINGD